MLNKIGFIKDDESFFNAFFTCLFHTDGMLSEKVLKLNDADLLDCEATLRRYFIKGFKEGINYGCGGCVNFSWPEDAPRVPREWLSDDLQPVDDSLQEEVTQ